MFMSFLDFFSRLQQQQAELGGGGVQVLKSVPHYGLPN